jgi:hypothetical protein
MAKAEYFDFTEFRGNAEALGFTKIARRAEDARAVPIESWSGVTTEAGSGYSHIGV